MDCDSRPDTRVCRFLVSEWRCDLSPAGGDTHEDGGWDCGLVGGNPLVVANGNGTFSAVIHGNKVQIASDALIALHHRMLEAKGEERKVLQQEYRKRFWSDDGHISEATLRKLNYRPTKGDGRFERAATESRRARP